MKRERLSALSRATKRTTQDLRERPSSRFDNDDSHLTKAFQRFAAEHVLPLVTIPGYKQDAKRTAIMQMVQQLLLTVRAEHCVADSRDKSDSQVQFRSKLWDSLEAAGLVDSIKGSEHSGKVTRYGASDKLLRVCEPLTTEDLIGGTELHRNSITPDDPRWHALVVLQTRKRIQPKQLVERIIKVHRKVAHKFFTEIGSQLTTVENIVMLRVLDSFALEQRPALCMHDGILCKRSDGDFARAMMKIHYVDAIGFEPIIKIAF